MKFYNEKFFHKKLTAQFFILLYYLFFISQKIEVNFAVIRLSDHKIDLIPPSIYQWIEENAHICKLLLLFCMYRSIYII